MHIAVRRIIECRTQAKISLDGFDRRVSTCGTHRNATMNGGTVDCVRELSHGHLATLPFGYGIIIGRQYNASNLLSFSPISFIPMTEWRRLWVRLMIKLYAAKKEYAIRSFDGLKKKTFARRHVMSCFVVSLVRMKFNTELVLFAIKNLPS